MTQDRARSATTGARCATLVPTLGDIWCSTNPQERAYAKALCIRCPIRYACANTGLADPAARGVWGGLDAGDRAAYRKGPAGPNPDDEADDALRRRVACDGSESSFLSHRTVGEDCPRCEQAHATRLETQRRARLQEEHAQGGTAAGAQIHRRLGETPCLECGQAEIVDRREAKARARAEGARAWAARGRTSGGAAGAQTATEQAA